MVRCRFTCRNIHGDIPIVICYFSIKREYFSNHIQASCLQKKKQKPYKSFAIIEWKFMIRFKSNFVLFVVMCVALEGWVAVHVFYQCAQFISLLLNLRKKKQFPRKYLFYKDFMELMAGLLTNLRGGINYIILLFHKIWWMHEEETKSFPIR